MSVHESRSCGSEYILNRILRLQARLLVSCFSRLGLDFPLKPEGDRKTTNVTRNSRRDTPALIPIERSQNCKLGFKSSQT